VGRGDYKGEEYAHAERKKKLLLNSKPLLIYSHLLKEARVERVKK